MPAASLPFCWYIQIRVFLIASLKRALAGDVSADTSFLCNKVSVIRDIVKGTLCMKGTFINLVTGTDQHSFECS